MSYKINDAVTWIGKIHWDFGQVLGKKLSTRVGTTYNSYLIKDEKSILIDTVWKPLGKEFVSELKKEINLNSIDYIVITHGEVDHSGGLAELMEEIPDTPIYCTKAAISSLKGHFHKDWNFIEVKTGDELVIGERKLVFYEAKMLHWPDSMFAYMTKDNILFSTDVFGQNYAIDESLLFDDCVDEEELYQRALKVYVNIFAPFSPIVKRNIQELIKLNLDIKTICPSHGVTWREKPEYIIEKYGEWSDNYSEDQVTIAYDTMRGGTEKMAQSIAEGIRQANPGTTIKLCYLGDMDNTDILTEIFKSKAVLIGSATMNNGIFPSIASLLELIKGYKLGNKRYAAFGCYGWSGESVNQINEYLKRYNFELINEGIKEKWNPSQEAIARCIEYGRDLLKESK
ncbi:MAG: MBL fold metallo-hydrolase [Tissierellales bacterium]